MEKSKLAISLLSSALLLTSLSAMAAPHFYLQVQNRSDKDASVSFKQDIGYVYLVPTLNDHTPLASHASSEKYEVHIEPLDPQDTFKVIFTGKQDCTFDIGYYAPGNPKVTISGMGCNGGGYAITDGGYTVLLFVSDINKK